MQLVDTPAQRIEKQRHQVLDFSIGAPPVLGAEGEQGDHLDVPTRTMANDALHGLLTGPMPLFAGQTPLASPAVIAIHDDRHMAHMPGPMGGHVRGCRFHHGYLCRETKTG